MTLNLTASVASGNMSITHLICWLQKMQRLRNEQQWQKEDTAQRYPSESCILPQKSLLNCQYSEMTGQLTRFILEHSLEGILITDARGRILDINPAFTRFTGYRAEECLGKTPRILLSGRHAMGFYEELCQSLIQKGQWKGEVWSKHKSGAAYRQKISVNSMSNPKGETTHYVAIFHHPPAIKHNQGQPLDLPLYDVLTGLPNRQLFRRYLNMALLQACSFHYELAVLFVDLDHFKLVNELYDYNIGDLVLQKATLRLQNCCRNTDTIARLGGDRFMILLPELQRDGQEAVEVAQGILAAFAEPFHIASFEIITTASIGITLYPVDGNDVATLEKHADIAVHKAKEHGRNTYQLYTKAMHEMIAAQIDLEQNFRKAFQNNEFEVHYQPQLDIKTGRMSGMEALVRWRRSARELLAPDTFIPLAEKSGLILPLGEWVLRTACTQTKIWHDAGFDSLSISVNLSPRQFQDAKLVQTVRDALDETGLAPKFLCLEITENMLMQDVNAAVMIMDALKEIGVYLSLDDFGTGYSSLNYLKRFPLDELKIDKSFISEIPAVQDDRAIVKAIMSLAHTLKLNVLAEGIEKPEQLEFVKKNGCDEIQGFLLSKPLQTEEMTIFLQKKYGRLCRKTARHSRRNTHGK